MRKYLSLILALLLTLSLSACGDKDENTGVEDTAPDTSVETPENTDNTEQEPDDSSESNEDSGDVGENNENVDVESPDDSATTPESSGIIKAGEGVMGYLVVDYKGDIIFMSSDETLADLKPDATNLVYDTPDDREVLSIKLEKDILYVETCSKTGGTKSSVSKITYPFNETYAVYKTSTMVYGGGSIPIHNGNLYFANSDQNLSAYNLETKESKNLKTKSDTNVVSNSNLILDKENERIYYLASNVSTNNASVCYIDLKSGEETVLIPDIKRGYSIRSKDNKIYYAADFIDDSMQRQFGIFSLDMTSEDIAASQTLVCSIETASKSFKSITFTEDEQTIYFINGNKIEQSANAGESKVVYTPEADVVLQRLVINSDDTLYAVAYNEVDKNQIVYKMTSGSEGLDAVEMTEGYYFELLEIMEEAK